MPERPSTMSITCRIVCYKASSMPSRSCSITGSGEPSTSAPRIGPRMAPTAETSLPAPGELDFGVVRVESLAAALEKLSIKGVSAKQLLAAAKEQENVKKPSTTNPSSEKKQLLLKEVKKPDSSPILPYKSTFVKKKVNLSAKSKERKKLLLAEIEADFPGGKFPDPHLLTWLKDATEAPTLPFIQATLVITSTDESIPGEQTFTNVWCLWDTGADISSILTSQLDPALLDGKDHGTVYASINLSQTTNKIETIIRFAPALPNNATFIILGQRGILDRIQYNIQPWKTNRTIRPIWGEAYGYIDLQYYADPIDDTNPNAQPEPFV